MAAAVAVQHSESHSCLVLLLLLAIIMGCITGRQTPPLLRAAATLGQPCMHGCRSDT